MRSLEFPPLLQVVQAFFVTDEGGIRSGGLWDELLQYSIPGEMVLVKNDITATWKAMEKLVASGGLIVYYTSEWLFLCQLHLIVLIAFRNR